MKIESIVKVDIKREVVSKTVRDLETIAILSVHTRFTDVFREYSDLTTMLEDGFLTTDFAYIAAQRIFAQDPSVARIIVGKAVGTDYVADVNALLAANPRWFYLITDADTDVKKEALADFIETEDLFYVTSDSNPQAIVSNDATHLGAKLKAKNLTKTLVLYYNDETTVAPEAAYVGYHATEVIGSDLWGYKTLTTLVANPLSGTAIAALRANNIQFYTKVGADDVIAGNMFVPNGEKIHVILGAIWLKIRLQEACWNLLYVNRRLRMSNADFSKFEAEMIRVFSEATNNNILSDERKPQIKMPDANRMTPQQRASGNLSGIEFRAFLAGAIIYVDGIKGTVSD